MMQHSNVYRIKSKSVIDALTNDDYDLSERPSNVFSATQIIDAPKPKELFRRHKDEIIVDVSDNFHTLDGSAVHYAVEKSGLGGKKERLTEERIFIEVSTLAAPWVGHTLPAGENITAQPWYDVNKLFVAVKFDCFEVNEGVVEDYKRCSVWETIYGLKDSRIQQLNIAAYALELLNFKVTNCRSCLFLKDWSSGDLRSYENKGDNKYPKIPYKEYEFAPWADDNIRSYIYDRVMIHAAAQKATDDAIPACSEEERWYRGESFAVMKEGVKTAKKVFKVEPGTTTKEEAMQYADAHAGELQTSGKKGEKYYVEPRPGQDIRCAGDKTYCAARTFCHYWREKYGNMNDSEY